MPQQMTGVLVLIASPGDAADERAAVADALNGWNVRSGRRAQVALLPWMWERNSIPRVGDRPQTLINSQAVDKADVVLAFFDSRLGTSTGVDVSGTAEEINRAVGQGKHVHVYFSDEPIPRDADLKQLKALNAFKTDLQDRALLGSYTDPADLAGQVIRAVEDDIEQEGWANRFDQPEERLPSGLDIELIVEPDPEIPRFIVPENWIQTWSAAERSRLLAPLPDPDETSGGTTTSFPAGAAAIMRAQAGAKALQQAAEAARAAESTLFKRHEETRDRDDYIAEVDAYLTECEQGLTAAAAAAQASFAEPVLLRVLNRSDRNYRGLQVRLHIEGDAEAFDEPVEFHNLRDFTPSPPRIWGPWVENRISVAHPYLPTAGFQSNFGVAGPTIVNGGSATVTFLPVDLRPRDVAELDLICVTAGPGDHGELSCTWSATAVNVDGRVEGTFALRRSDSPVDITTLLQFDDIQSD